MKKLRERERKLERAKSQLIVMIKEKKKNPKVFGLVWLCLGQCYKSEKRKSGWFIGRNKLIVK